MNNMMAYATTLACAALVMIALNIAGEIGGIRL